MDGGAAARQTPEKRHRPTMQEVADAAGVSKALVSLILSGSPGPSAATTERVLEIAERVGYRANRTAALLARRRTRLLGVTILPSNVFHGELAEEIQAAAEAAGYEIVLGSTTGTTDESHSIETLIDFRCEALLLLGPTMPAARLAAIIDTVPSVIIGRPLDLPSVDVVRADDRQGITAVVDHLVSLGHRGIAHLDGGAGAIADLRRRAYRAAVKRHGIPAVVVRGGPTEQDGARSVDALPADAGITAVIAFNDRAAVGVLDRLERRGLRVPADVSVAGFDDSLMARHSRIDLTTVSQGHLEQARRAVELSLERLDTGRTERREIVLPAEIIVRGSTSRASNN